MNSQVRVKRTASFPCRSVEGEGVIVSTQKGAAILLNGVGFQVWNWLDDPRTVGELTQLISQQYSISDEVSAQDLSPFLKRLAELELVELK